MGIKIKDYWPKLSLLAYLKLTQSPPKILKIMSICTSLIIRDTEHFFMCLYVFFGKMSIHVFCPFFDWVVCVFNSELHDLFIYFGD